MLLFPAPARASGSCEGSLGYRLSPRTAGGCLHVRHGTCGGSHDVSACSSYSLQAASAEEQKALWAAGVRYKQSTADHVVVQAVEPCSLPCWQDSHKSKQLFSVFFIRFLKQDHEHLASGNFYEVLPSFSPVLHLILRKQ